MPQNSTGKILNFRLAALCLLFSLYGCAGTYTQKPGANAQAESAQEQIDPSSLPAFVPPEKPINYNCKFDINHYLPHARPQEFTIGELSQWAEKLHPDGNESAIYLRIIKHAHASMFANDFGKRKRFYFTVDKHTAPDGNGYLVNFAADGFFRIYRVPAEYTGHFPGLSKASSQLYPNRCKQ